MRQSGGPAHTVSLYAVLAIYWSTGLVCQGQIENFAKYFLDSKSCISTNVVLSRGDDTGWGDDHASEVRPWSISWHTYGHEGLQSMEYCSNNKDLLKSLRSGHRLHQKGVLLDSEMEQAASTWFAPHGCIFRWFSPLKICHILGKFPQIRMVGDSLLRHVNQALFMLLKGDLQYGALPYSLQDVDVYNRCRCDGQFSEHALCRVGEMMSLADPRQLGVCHGDAFQAFALTMRETGRYTLDWNDDECPHPDRPFVVLLGAGSHQKSNASATIADVIDPFMAELQAIALACPHASFQVLYIGLGAQSRQLDAKYPHQQRESTLAFNKEMAAHLKIYHNVDMLDVWSLTEDAPTSDGYHHLTDVNVVTALYFLNYLDNL